MVGQKISSSTRRGFPTEIGQQSKRGKARIKATLFNTDVLKRNMGYGGLMMDSKYNNGGNVKL